MAFLHKQFTVTLTIDNQDEVFIHFVDWYSKQGYGDKARSIKCQNGQWGYGATLLSVGYGVHYFRIGLRFFKLSRVKSEGSTFGTTIKESISITTLGRSQKPLRKILDLCTEEVNSSKDTKVYIWNGESWKYTHSQPPRSLDSVVMSAVGKKRLLARIKKYEGDKEFYMKHGIPYNFGLAFHGIPGTGKTSIAKALCGHLNRNLYRLNLGVMSDRSLENAFSLTKEDSLVLIEDFDTCEQTLKRHNVQRQIDQYKNPPSNTIGEYGKGDVTQDIAEPSVIKSSESGFSFLTLSGILNAINGACAGSGRIMVVTTNDWDSIDPALKRKGRISFNMELKPVDAEIFTIMIERFYPGYSVPVELELKSGITPADVEEYVLEHRDDPDLVVSLCCLDNQKFNSQPVTHSEEVVLNS